MAIFTLAPPQEKIQLSGISWRTYETLLEELSHRHFRLTYYRGILEIMAPSPEHEVYKKVFGRFVETLAEEFSIEIYPFGSTTLKRAGSSGSEPDESFYTNPTKIEIIRGKKRIDSDNDPVPDLAVEIDITSSAELRLEVYAELGVPEVWVYNGTELRVWQFQQGHYILATESGIFSGIPIREIRSFLERIASTNYLMLVREFREWVRQVRTE